MNQKQKVGQRLRQARINCGLTQAELGRNSGLSGDWICSIERGRRGMDSSTLLKLSRSLGVSVDHLLGVNGKPNKSKGKSNGQD